MCIRRPLLAILVFGGLLHGWPRPSQADEFAFSAYGLGGAAFGAGLTPPPGTYVSFVAGYYAGAIRGPVTVGGLVFDAGAKASFFQAALNGLHVLEHKVLGGRLGVGITVPVGHVDLEAGVAIGPLVAKSQTKGWGLGDISPRVQLGWEHGTFSHLVYAQGILPTGRYDHGFNPNIGLNRPGLDMGWAFTYADKQTKWQFNGSLGFTFNAENDDTHYRSGTDFHFEWAVGKEITRGLVLGIVGYDFRQLTGDTGTGAVLGPFKGKVDAIGPGISYTTLFGQTPLVLNLRHYQEFDAEHRMEGRMTIFSGTVRF